LQLEAGQQPEVLLQTAPPGWMDARLPFLPQGVTARPIALHTEADLPKRWQAAGLHDFPWHRLPANLRQMVLDLTGELLLRPVDVLHCWIDEANIVGWLAARLAGIRCTVMTVLGVSPAHWPLGDRPWLRALARQAVRAAGTRLVAISEAGRSDYAQWLDEEPSRIEVIRIGFSLPSAPTPDHIAAFRAAHKLSPETPVVIGVFRLDPEKRPLTFLEVVARVRRTVPEVRVFLAGHGILADQVRQQILRLELHQTVTLLGQAEDVLTPIAAADVFLMCSQVEGTPNVSLEAQALGCVPVLTDVGGCRETLLPGKTGEVVDRDDLDGLAAAVVRLLQAPARRRAMAAAGREFVARTFSPEQLARRFEELYSRLEHE
jgi:glycosyltransferase involved in cell wall biosynthesis